MQLTIYQVDAFTDHLFEGNPAAVVPLDKWLPDPVMQNIAAENNLAETAFFIPDNGAFIIRWFTPTKEVELCGHATLATAHVLYEHLEFSGESCIFHTMKRGILEVRKTKEGLTMDFPRDQPREIVGEEKQAISDLLKLNPVYTGKGADDLLIVVEDYHQVMDYLPDLDAIARLDARGIVLSSGGNEKYDFISRCFYPKYGIDEDPATGSAHTLLTPYWAGRLHKNRLRALQASSRSGILVCENLPDRVLLTGKAVTYLQGQIYLDDGLSPQTSV